MTKISGTFTVEVPAVVVAGGYEHLRAYLEGRFAETGASIGLFRPADAEEAD